MGGITTLATTGLQATNLVDGGSNEKKEFKRQMRFEFQNRKNLLDEQLAARRASLGAMGLNSSGSADAVRNRMVNDFYEDAKNIASSSGQKQGSAQNKTRSSLIGSGNKAIQTMLK